MRKPALLLFLLIFFSYAFLNRGGYDGYELENFLTAESLVHLEGIWLAEGYTDLPGLAPTVSVRRFPRNPYGQVIFTVPFYLAGELAQQIFPDFRLTQLGKSKNRVDQLRAGPLLAFALEAPAIAALTVIYIFLWLNRFGLTEKRSSCLSLLAAFGSLLFPYAAIGTEAFLTLCLLAASYHLFDFPNLSRKDWALGGGFLVFLINSKIYGAVFALPLFIILAYPYIKSNVNKELIHLILIVFAGGLALWFTLLLRQAVALGPTATGGGHDLGGFLASYDLNLLLINLYTFTLSTGKGLFIYSPLLILSVLGLKKLRQKSPRFVLLLAGYSLALIVLVFPLKFAALDEMWGPRYLLPLVPWLTITSSLFISRCWTTLKNKLLIGALASASILIQLPGVLYWGPMPLQVAFESGASSMEEIVFVPQFSPVYIGLKTLAALPVRWGIFPYDSENPPSYQINLNSGYSQQGKETVWSKPVDLVKAGKLVPWSLRFIERKALKLSHPT